MSVILNDTELKKLIGTVIVNGDSDSIGPNSYALRLGNEGEFLNAGKTFELGKSKKGIRISPGHSVAVTALETLDFRVATVEKIYPGCALHAFVTPTTSLSREGIVAPTTQVDAGYNGTLNWTLTNTANEERRYLCGERLYRLTILKLNGGEVPLTFYEGDYQGKTGYVRSQRKGPPVGMRESDWADSTVEGGPESLLDNLIKSGYPWHVLGQKLKTIDEQFKIVTDEYEDIKKSLNKLEREMDKQNEQERKIPEVIRGILKEEIRGTLKEEIRGVLKEESAALQNRWLLTSGALVMTLLGLVISLTSNPQVFDFIKAQGAWIGIVTILFGVSAILFFIRRP